MSRLCRLGLHSWKMFANTILPTVEGTLGAQHRVCRRCGKEQKRLVKGAWINVGK